MRYLLLSIAFFGICTLSPAQSPIEVNEVYLKELDNWQKSMNRWKLRNFVPLVGLHLLKEGENSFGRGSTNSIVVDSKSAPELMGVIIKDGNTLTYKNSQDIEAKLEGKSIDEITYTFDADRNSERLNVKFVKWYIQYVQNEYFLRVMDETSPLVGAFEPYDYFPGTDEFIFKGKYKEYNKVKVIELKNVIASSEYYNHTGSVSFKYKGEKYTLEVLEGRILMFQDATNGDSTFPHGRYLRIKIEEDNSVVLDFNRAFSPPRSVSLYTTCEIPPKQNILPFAITSGEMYRNSDEPIIRSLR